MNRLLCVALIICCCSLTPAHGNNLVDQEERPLPVGYKLHPKPHNRFQLKQQRPQVPRSTRGFFNGSGAQMIKPSLRRKSRQWQVL